MSGQGVSSVPRLPIRLAIQLKSYGSAVVLCNRLMVSPPFSFYFWMIILLISILSPTANRQKYMPLDSSSLSTLSS
jgi:hypothetical protein